MKIKCWVNFEWLCGKKSDLICQPWPTLNYVILSKFRVPGLGQSFPLWTKIWVFGLVEAFTRLCHRILKILALTRPGAGSVVWIRIFGLCQACEKKNIQVLGLGQALWSKIWGLDVGFLTWLCDQKSKFLAFVRKSDSRPGLSNLDQALRSELFYPGPGSRFENLIIFCPWSASVPENPIFVAMARLCVRKSKFSFASARLCVRKFESLLP